MVPRIDSQAISTWQDGKILTNPNGNSLASGFTSSPFYHHRQQSSTNSSLSSSIFTGSVVSSTTTSPITQLNKPYFAQASSSASPLNSYLLNGLNSTLIAPINNPQPSLWGKKYQWNANQETDSVAPSITRNFSSANASQIPNLFQRKRQFSFPQSQAEQNQVRSTNTVGHSRVSSLSFKRHRSFPADSNIISSLKNKFNKIALKNATSTLSEGQLASIELDVLALSKDQCGCRFLQRKIDEDFATNYPLIFNCAYHNAAELMVDPFGNYLIQKVTESAGPDELGMILNNIGPSVYFISVNQYGTRAFQRLIDCLSIPEHHSMVQAFVTPHLVNLIRDTNGNHVVQKCIQKFQDRDLQFIVDSVAKNIVPISTHKHGCCVIQKLINKCNPVQVAQLGRKIVDNSLILMEDQFGNYVVQYLISLELQSFNSELLAIVSSYIVELSCQKFSSNVVEKCLRIHVYRNSVHLMNPLLLTVLSQEVLTRLARDQFGNYVVQTAIDVSPLAYKVKFASSLLPILPSIRFTTFGKRIHSKISTILTDAQKFGTNDVWS